MKLFYKLFFFLFILPIANNSQAQDIDNASQYMSFIGTQRENISKKYLSYASASAHGKEQRK